MHLLTVREHGDRYQQTVQIPPLRIGIHVANCQREGAMPLLLPQCRLGLLTKVAAPACVEEDLYHGRGVKRRIRICGRRERISTIPARNPPTCANQATPPCERCEEDIAPTPEKN